MRVGKPVLLAMLAVYALARLVAALWRAALPGV